MNKINTLFEHLKTSYSGLLQAIILSPNNEVTLEVSPQHLRQLCHILRDESAYQFDMLIDVCGVDYLDYGKMDWQTDEASTTGFSRGVEQSPQQEQFIHWDKPRYAVVYHLLSTVLNHRIRLKCFCPEKTLMLDSIVDIWKSADWFERECYDLFGILFNGHPDLRRILTDYGFIGHPFRKDFPLSGQVEMRYDAKEQRIVYEPVDIEPRVLVPKVGRREQPAAEKTNA